MSFILQSSGFKNISQGMEDSLVVTDYLKRVEEFTSLIF